MPAKEQKCMLLVVTRYSGKKCTKLVLKPLAGEKRPLYFSPVHCSFPIYYTVSISMMTILHFCTLLDLFT